MLCKISERVQGPPVTSAGSFVPTCALRATRNCYAGASMSAVMTSSRSPRFHRFSGLAAKTASLEHLLATHGPGRQGLARWRIEPAHPSLVPNGFDHTLHTQASRHGCQAAGARRHSEVGSMLSAMSRVWLNMSANEPGGAGSVHRAM
jgi:hypothetical protein